MSATDYQLNPNVLAPAIPKELIGKAYKIFEIPSTSHNEVSMSLHICSELKRMNIDYYLDDYGNIIATKQSANIPFLPCFCAHLDTVHMYPKGYDVRLVKDEKRLYIIAEDNDHKRVGVGGDDKCGIFVCLYLLEHLDNIKTIFFSSEESGGTGSRNIDLEEFKNCKFLGGIDRWNGHDFINRYSAEYTISKEFKNAIDPIMKQYGYSFNSGLFTDSFNVMDRGINLSCFNLSCGYYSHHSSEEYVDLNELYNACLICMDLAVLPNRYNHTIPKKEWPRTTYNYWNGTDDKDSLDYTNRWRNNWKNYKYKDFNTTIAQRTCECCGIVLFSNEKRYCTTCKPYFTDNTERWDIYD